VSQETVLKDLRGGGLLPQSYAIAPLAHHVLWTNTRWPSPTDDQSTISWDGGEWQDFANRQKYPTGWDDSLIVEVDCPICGSLTADEQRVPANVLLEEAPLNQKKLVPEGFRCYICGFSISPCDRYLARHFVPTIDPDVAGAYLKGVGIE
jgi:hypothetical protein